MSHRCVSHSCLPQLLASRLKHSADLPPDDREVARAGEDMDEALQTPILVGERSSRPRSDGSRISRDPTRHISNLRWTKHRLGAPAFVIALGLLPACEDGRLEEAESGSLGRDTVADDSENRDDASGQRLFPPRSSPPAADADIQATPDNSRNNNEGVSGEFGNLPPPKIEFQWADEAKYRASESVLSSSTISGVLTNLTDGDLAVEVHATGDAGTNRTTRQPTWLLDVPAESSADVHISLDLFEFAPHDSQRFSGKIGVKFRGYDAAEFGDYTTLYASEVYFHPDGEGFLFYSGETLRSVHRAGDFSGLEDLPADAGTVIDRVVDGVRVDYSPNPRTSKDVIDEGDDGTPGEGGNPNAP